MILHGNTLLLKMQEKVGSLVLDGRRRQRYARVEVDWQTFGYDNESGKRRARKDRLFIIQICGSLGEKTARYFVATWGRAMICLTATGHNEKARILI